MSQIMATRFVLPTERPLEAVVVLTTAERRLELVLWSLITLLFLLILYFSARIRHEAHMHVKQKKLF